MTNDTNREQLLIITNKSRTNQMKRKSHQLSFFKMVLIRLVNYEREPEPEPPSLIKRSANYHAYRSGVTNQLKKGIFLS